MRQNRTVLSKLVIEIYSALMYVAFRYQTSKTKSNKIRLYV